MEEFKQTTFTEFNEEAILMNLIMNIIWNANHSQQIINLVRIFEGILKGMGAISDIEEYEAKVKEIEKKVNEQYSNYPKTLDLRVQIQKDIALEKFELLFGYIMKKRPVQIEVKLPEKIIEQKMKEYEMGISK